jgi:ribosomal protein S18 acetylase RimI-like enzyme
MPSEIDNRSVLVRRAIGADADVSVANSQKFNIEDGHPASTGAIGATLHLLEPDCRDGLILVVLIDGTIRGHGVLCFGYGTELGGRDSFLEEIYIEPEMRSCGLGSVLMRGLENAARDSGCKAIYLEVMADNPAERLYRRMGFEGRASKLLSKTI